MAKPTGAPETDERKDLFAAKFAFRHRQVAFGPPLSAEEGLATLEALDASYEAFDTATQVLLREAAGQFMRVTQLTGVSAISVDISLGEYAEFLKTQAGREEDGSGDANDELDDVWKVAAAALRQLGTAPLTLAYKDNLHTFHWLAHGALYDHPSGEGFVLTLQFGSVTTTLLEMAAHLEYERSALPVWLQVS